MDLNSPIASELWYTSVRFESPGPGLRIGYVAAPVPLIERIAAHRSHFDTQGDQVLEYVVGELLDEGEIQRHIRRVRRVPAAPTLDGRSQPFLRLGFASLNTKELQEGVRRLAACRPTH